MGDQSANGSVPTAAAPGINFDAVSALKFPAPQSFSGDEQKFELFQNKLKSYLGLSNPNFKSLMNQARDSDDAIDWDVLGPDSKAMAVQLQNALIALTDGPPAKIVQKYPDTENGFETWRRLCQRYSGPNRSRATGRMSTILNYQFNQSDFETSFETWEAEIEKYDTEQPVKFPDEIKIGLLTAKAPPQLRQYLMLNTDLQTPYDEIRKFVVSYFRNGRVMTQIDRSSKGGTVPMEVDAILQQQISAFWKI